MNKRKFLEEHLRGWLPKETKIGETKLGSIRKPTAVVIIATLLVASVSIFASYFVFNRPPTVPEPITLVPNDNNSGASNSTTPTNSTSPDTNPPPSRFSESPNPSGPSESSESTTNESTTTPPVQPQEPVNMLWNKTYGGAGDDVGNSVVQTSDGGYAIAGYTESFGDDAGDLWLIKTDSGGNKQWSKTYGGMGSEAGNAIILTNDGGFAIAGYTNSFGAGDFDMWLVKTDANGNLQWNKTYGGNAKEIAYSVIQTIDGGYAVVGSTESFEAGNLDVYLVKADSSGNMQWNKTYGGPVNDTGYSIIQTNEGGYAITGEMNPLGGNNDAFFYIVKTDPKGNLEWQKYYGWSGSGGFSIIHTSDGGYAIAGYESGVYHMPPYYSILLVKTDADGNIEWETKAGMLLPYTFSTPASFTCCVIQLNDGGYAIAGTYSQSSNNKDVWLFKVDADGNLVWEQKYAEAGKDFGNSLIQTNDGGVVIVGRTTSYGTGDFDVWLIKIGAR
jgi:hypothetical protein